MSHINYAFNPEDDALPRDKMKLRNIASTKYSGDWPSIPHSHSYAELFYIVDGEGQFQINDKLVPRAGAPAGRGQSQRHPHRSQL